MDWTTYVTIGLVFIIGVLLYVPFADQWVENWAKNAYAQGYRVIDGKIIKSKH